MCFLLTYFNFLPSNLSSIKQNSVKFVSTYINQIGILANNENVKLKLLHKRRYIHSDSRLIVAKMYRKPTDVRHLVIKLSYYNQCKEGKIPQEFPPQCIQAVSAACHFQNL